MKRRISRVRIITGTVLLVLAMCLFVGAYVTWTDLGAAWEAEPVNMEVDLSSSGKYSSSFRTTYHAPLGIELQLRFGGGLSSHEPSLADLDGLEGEICITDNKGHVVIMQDFTAENFQRDLSMRVLFGKRQDTGWMITVDIAKPAAALKDTEQLLTATYSICGLAVMPVQFAVIGGLICVAVAIKIMRPKKKSESSSGGEVHVANVS